MQKTNIQNLLAKEHHTYRDAWWEHHHMKGQLLFCWDGASSHDGGNHTLLQISIYFDMKTAGLCRTAEDLSERYRPK